jgi:hypothetical protein
MDTTKPETLALKTITLPGGKVATIRKGTGKDLRMAQRMVGNDSDPTAIGFALIARLTEIDGQTIVFEDVDLMPLADVLMLTGEVMGENFQFPPLPGSPRSSNSGSTQLN